MINSIVISSCVKFARNFKNIPFPNKLCDFESASSISKAVFEILGEDYEFRSLKNLSGLQCLKLLEEDVISKDLIGNKDISGYAISPDLSVVIMINEEDHIREKCVLDGLNLVACYQKLSKIDNMILNKVDVAFSSELGFLTASPNNIGTGMRACVTLFLPALTLNGTISSLAESLSQSGVVVKKVYNEDSAYQGYFYQFSNKFTLGMSEKDIIDLVEKTVKKVVEMEEFAQDSLKKSQKDVIIDLSYRAYGVLTNSYTISLQEATELLSKIRFALTLGVIKFRNSKIIDELYTSIQPAHLMDNYSLELNPKEQDLFRAKYISECLDNKLIKGV